MTDPDKPLRLTSKRRKTHAAGATRRLLFGLSAAGATVMASTMADAAQTSAQPLPTTTTAPEPIVIHVQVTRPWAPAATAPPRRATRNASAAVAPAPSAPPQPSARPTTPSGPSAAAAPAPATQPTTADPTPAPAPVVTSPRPTSPPTTASRAS